jgi:hypothetical protein
MAYNMLNCQGFEGPAFGGGCTLSWAGIPILFFLFALINKWGGEDMGFNFNFMWALIFCFAGYFLTITIFGNFKIALVVGIVAGLVGGYGSGMMFGGGYE